MKYRENLVIDIGIYHRCAKQFLAKLQKSLDLYISLMKRVVNFNFSSNISNSIVLIKELGSYP